MWENFHKFTQYTHFLSVTKNDLSKFSTGQSFHGNVSTHLDCSLMQRVEQTKDVFSQDKSFFCNREKVSVLD